MLSATRSPELDACRSRITNVKKHADNLSICINQSLTKKHHVESQLGQAKPQHAHFKTFVAQKRTEWQQKTTHLQNLRTKATALNRDCEAAISRISKAESAITQKRSEIQSTKDRISQIRDKIESIDPKIQNLRNELMKPRPHPQTQRIPGKCYTGKVNCQNHPNYGAKNITTNKAEIDRYDSKKDELSQLLEDKNELSQEADNLGSKLSGLNNSLSQEQFNLSEAQRQKNAKTSEIQQNTKLQENATKEQLSLNQEISDAEGRVSSLSNQIGSLTQQQLQENNMITTTQHQLKSMTLEAQRLSQEEVGIKDRLMIDKLQSEQQLRALAVRQLAIRKIAQQKIAAEKHQNYGVTATNNGVANSYEAEETTNPPKDSFLRQQNSFFRGPDPSPKINITRSAMQSSSTVTSPNQQISTTQQGNGISSIPKQSTSKPDTSLTRKPAFAAALPIIADTVAVMETGGAAATIMETGGVTATIGRLATGATITKFATDNALSMMEQGRELYDKIRGPPPSVEQEQNSFRPVSTLPVRAIPNTSTVTPWGTPADTSTSTVSQPNLAANTLNKNQGDEAKDSTRSASVKDRVRQFECETFPSREAAFRKAKNDAGIPSNQQPLRVEHVPLRDGSKRGNPPIIENGEVVQSREYHYQSTSRTGPNPATGQIPKEIVIQEHSLGHTKGNQKPHFNVRPVEPIGGKEANSQQIKGSIEGTDDHYCF